VQVEYKRLYKQGFIKPEGRISIKSFGTNADAGSNEKTGFDITLDYKRNPVLLEIAYREMMAIEQSLFGVLISKKGKPLFTPCNNYPTYIIDMPRLATKDSWKLLEKQGWFHSWRGRSDAMKDRVYVAGVIKVGGNGRPSIYDFEDVNLVQFGSNVGFGTFETTFKTLDMQAIEKFYSHVDAVYKKGMQTKREGQVKVEKHFDLCLPISLAGREFVLEYNA